MNVTEKITTENKTTEIYQHTQKSPLFLILILLAGAMSILAWTAKHDSMALGVLLTVAGIFFVLAFSFYTLTTTVNGNRLSVRYGPIPLFGTSFNLIEVDEVMVSKTAVIDGWGIHYIPFRGWTFNLWGFNCVKIQLGNRVVRVGTDDPENLAHHLTASSKSIKGQS